MLIALMIFLLSGVIAAGAPIEKTEKSVGDQPGNDLSVGQIEFGFRLFDGILNEDFGGNVFISPLSASFALAMVYNGSDKMTKEAMAEALGLQGAELLEINNYFDTLMSGLLEADPKIEINIANSIWSKKGLAFKKEFFARAEKFFDARLETLEKAEIINDWVRRETNDKIRSIIDRIDPMDVMILINAIYFKGEWTRQFKMNKTREQEFTLLDGTVKMHPLMHQSGNFDYYENNDFQAVRLPYSNNKFGMYVFLPSEETGLKSFLDNLNATNWQTWITKFIQMDGDLALPRFKLEYEKLLNSVLSNMGMAIAFTDKADFSSMIEPAGKVAISAVKQKTFVEVNEKGTEAAAATSVTMILTNAHSEPQRFRMVVDRPFFCAITDNRSGAILFMGTIVDPRE
jgi:serpin B